MKRSIIILALLGSINVIFAQDVDKLINKNDVERVIKTLSADDMQGRATFTSGIEKAAKFIENEYKTIALQPMEGNSSFRQNFSMIRSSAVKTAVAINGAAIPEDNYIALAKASFSWTKTDDATISVITADMDLRKEYLKYLVGDKSGLVIVDPKHEAFFKRLQAHVKNTISFKDSPGAPVVFILGKYDEVKSLNISDEVKSEELPLFNIAGIIPGKTKPDEFVVFSGHYDHLGILTGANVMQGDSIANGADDDASGTTAVITLAKYFKKLNNNARTLVFVAFTAEEIGEYGSAYFAKTMNPNKVTAMFNIEMIGKASKWGINSAFITGIERSDFGPILQKNLEGTAFKFYA
ncbi:MAG: family metallo-hydrolase, partial [Mucilaginibacter sp.]|nr:family metallo-hydrolase [Mucilaginibacter sp.]